MIAMRRSEWQRVVVFKVMDAKLAKSTLGASSARIPQVGSQLVDIPFHQWAKFRQGATSFAPQPNQMAARDRHE